MTYIASTMSRVGHAQGVGKWVTQSNDVANACKQNTHGIGKARAGKCQACTQKGHVQVGAWCAQARKHTRTQRVLLTLGLGYVCDSAGCVWNMHAQCPEQRTHRGSVFGSPRVWPFSTGWQHTHQVQFRFLVLAILVVCVTAPSRRPCMLQYVHSSWVATLLVCTCHSEFLADAPQCRAGVHAQWR